MSIIWQHIFVHFLTCIVKFNYYIVINKDFSIWIYFKLIDNSHFTSCHHFEIGYTRSTKIDCAIPHMCVALVVDLFPNILTTRGLYIHVYIVNKPQLKLDGEIRPAHVTYHVTYQVDLTNVPTTIQR